MANSSRITNNNRLFFLVSASALVLIPAAARAVVVPNAARPETIGRQFKLDEKRPEVSNKPIVAVGDQSAKQLNGGISFELKEIKFEGASQLNTEELKQFYQDKIGKKISLQELNKIASDITAYYRNQGLILTRAIVPPQKIDKGVVKIRIIEGFVSDVQLRGDVGSADSVLYSYAEKIKASKPLDAAMLERYLLLMEDVPGVEARAVLQPSPTVSGASQVIVNITRRTLEGSTASIDNRGTRFLGPIQATGALTANNILGLDEQTTMRVVNTPSDPSELKFFSLRHEEQLGSEGTKLIFDGNFIESKPQYTLEPFDIRGQNYSLDVAVTHPLLRSRQSNWFINSDFSVSRVNLDVLGVNFYQDNLRVLKAGSSYDFVDSTNAVNRLEGAFSKGFSWDADNNGLAHSRANGESSFWKFTANATRVQPIWGAFSASLAVDGQYSADPLLSTEEYSLGGKQFGSAYDNGELSGDSGLATRAELQYNGSVQEDFLKTYQLYSFYDIGKVWNRDIIAASEYKAASLASAGVGTRFNVVQALSGEVEVAFPLTRKVAVNGEDGDAPRFFFNLQYRY